MSENDKGKEVILLPTMLGGYIPNQTALCEIVIDFIRKYNLEVMG
jgi:hypothetical protein